MDNELLLFALGASRAFGAKVAEAIGAKLSQHEEREFEDGEHKARPLVNVRGRDVYVVYSLYGDDGQSANDKLIRLLFFAGALRDASAGRVTAVVPYLAYARKDRKSKARDPVTTRYVAELFEAIGVDRIVALDVHNPAAYQNAFRCRTEHLEAASLFVRRIAPMIGDAQAAVVAPDAGGIKRAETFRRRLGNMLGQSVPLAFAEKHRSAGVVSGDAFVGDVAGRTAIIVDDLISSGTTMSRTAMNCRSRGARVVYAVASHGVFAEAANGVLGGSEFDRIFVTDSVPPLRVTNPALGAKLECVSVAGLVGEAIGRLHANGSLVELTQA